MKQRISTMSDTTLLLILAGGGVLLHTLLNGQYGFHRDELDILMNARQLDWGYVAYPPFTPFIARIGLLLFGPSLQGLRFFPALAQGVILVLAGLMARDMGGRRTAQVMAAIAAAIAPTSLMAGTLFIYAGFDYLWWVVIAFFFVRLLATENPRYWLGIGAAIGLGMMNKYTIIFWVLALVLSVLITPLRRYLKSKWLWLGVGLALLIYLPNLIWQVQHGFISLQFLGTIHARDVQWGRADSFFVEQFYSSTNPFTLPLWIAGLIGLFLSPLLKRFRPLAWMYLITMALFVITRGRGYYTAPAYIMLLAAGSVWWVSWLEARSQTARRWGYGLLFGLLVLGGLVGVVIAKPVAPINSALWKVTSEINHEVVEMVGWQDLTAQVAAVYQAIPAAEKPGTVILAGNYGEAGALDLYGKDYDLPPIISGANSLWYRGYGSPEPQTVIVVGFDRPYAEKFFADCTTVGSVSNRYNVQNEESSRHTGLYVCRQPQRPWNVMWQDMQWFQ